MRKGTFRLLLNLNGKRIVSDLHPRKRFYLPFTLIGIHTVNTNKFINQQNNLNNKQMHC